MKHASGRRWLIAILLLTNGVGCSYIEQKQREEQLTRVAKDWSMTIRASQVIPVYPMTEDLQPGDVFLVRRPVDDQHREYRDKGYLSFDYHLARLRPESYGRFYSDSFFNGDDRIRLPRTWLQPGEATSFSRAPAAAFPAYSFSVKNGAGFSAALPIQGVPVGLAMLGSAAGNGSVTIKNARTYGLDIESLASDVLNWSRQPDTAAMLRNYAPQKTSRGKIVRGTQTYVRVVSRVYLTGRLNVSLTSTDSAAAGVDVGAKVRPVDLPLLTPSTQPADVTAASYADGLRRINETLNPASQPASQPATNPTTKPTTSPAVESSAAAAIGESVPSTVASAATPDGIGASLRVTAVSARSISIDETFPRPVVIGYLGFDMAITPEGVLGPPIPTYAVLEQQQTPTAEKAFELMSSPASLTRSVASYRYLEEVAGRPETPAAASAKSLRAKLDEVAQKILPATRPLPVWQYAQGTLSVAIEAGAPAGQGFRGLGTYTSQLEESQRALLQAAREGKGNADTRAQADLTRAELDRIRGEFSTLIPLLRELDSFFWSN